MIKDSVDFFSKRLIRQSYKYSIRYIANRKELPYMLNSKKLLGEGAEIGVAKGVFSQWLLKNWHGFRLYSIDPWKEYPAEEYRDNKNVSQEEFEKIYYETVKKLSQFKERSNIIRLTSAEASNLFEEGQLDFVYLDAQHKYSSVKEDIEIWSKKIKKGGILAGHDYYDGFINNCEFGVKSAVDEFAKMHSLKLFLSREPRNKSWFMFV